MPSGGPGPGRGAGSDAGGRALRPARSSLPSSPGTKKRQAEVCVCAGHATRCCALTRLGVHAHGSEGELILEYKTDNYIILTAGSMCGSKLGILFNLG